MSLFVEFRLRGDAIEMTEVAAALPDVTLEIETWRKSGEQVIWYIWAEGGELDRVTAEFDSLAHVVGTEVINDGSYMRLYRVTMFPNIETPPDQLLMHGTLTEGYIRPSCLHLTGRISGRDMLAGVWNYLRGYEIDVEVERLRRDGPRDANGTDSDGSDLTPEQFDALVTAYEMGYFDESVRVTQSEVAEELDISRSSFSERLRRAERKLVRAQLGSRDGPSTRDRSTLSSTD